MDKIDHEALEQMRARSCDPWYCYQNADLSSTSLGHMKFLRAGKDSTFKIPPQVSPDTPQQINWRYRFVGIVNLESGEVDEYSWIEKHQHDYLEWRKEESDASTGDKRV